MATQLDHEGYEVCWITRNEKVFQVEVNMWAKEEERRGRADSKMGF